MHCHQSQHGPLWMSRIQISVLVCALPSRLTDPQARIPLCISSSPYQLSAHHGKGSKSRTECFWKGLLCSWELWQALCRSFSYNCLRLFSGFWTLFMPIPNKPTEHLHSVCLAVLKGCLPTILYCSQQMYISPDFFPWLSILFKHWGNCDLSLIPAWKL